MKLLRLPFICRRLHSLPKNIIVSPAVKDALASNKGVVALESTVITHGLPYPQNLETAKSLEEAVRSEGCEPATIALIDGNVHIGLTAAELSRVADSMDSMKVSRRDIAYALNKASSTGRGFSECRTRMSGCLTLFQGVVGGTTVAATMYLANMANIKVFATGGIGGVHRGADKCKFFWQATCMI
ncbi:indigoidine synthase A-like protein [Ancylostoma ceylanicum]|uniref:Indigoidine synthase A-like protein n=1 Tax=Ancylostoma ceylanicum TaxID=53326 RepID=A0A0D6LQ22_9BILA|nr:indigoidine synthase A-like protein [Ancylostoma ceylanicum]